MTYVMRADVSVSSIFVQKDSRCGSSISTLEGSFVYDVFYSLKFSNITRLTERTRNNTLLKTDLLV